MHSPDDHRDPDEPRDRDDRALRELLPLVRSGSPAELAEFLGRCEPHVLRIVRRRLNAKLRSRFDSQDFAQAVWASFFANTPSFSGFDREEDLLAYLGAMAANKVVEQNRAHLRSGKRRIDREVGLDESPPIHEATPSQFAMANECWERLTDDLSEKHRELVELRAAGNTVEEVAREKGLDERTVRRLFARLKRRTAG
jgi:RNA polymerase sigma factor (sigma-70 family)